MKTVCRLLLALTLAGMLAMQATTPVVYGAASGYVGYPYFYIASVVQDAEVTITPYNFPPNDTFVVTMGYYGTLGIGGIEVATVTTDASGNLSQTTFAIPSSLAGQTRIAIRLESPATGYYAYNWFWNNTAVTIPGYSGYPTFAIATVTPGVDVTIVPNNFTPNDAYRVLIGRYGTLGIGGIEVATVTTDASGNLSQTTFAIPSSLASEIRLAIRLESPTTGYYAYNWFWNNTTTSGGTAGGTAPTPVVLPWPGYPYFYIAAVVKDTSVTIQPHNFPPNDTYTVRMNYYGTLGIGGIEVATVATDADGNLSQTTFTIPASLAGQTRIAIRLDSPSTGYYAYNWFWNTTATVSVP